MKAETKFIRKIQNLSEDEEFQKRHIRNIEKDHHFPSFLKNKIVNCSSKSGIMVSINKTKPQRSSSHESIIP